MTFPFIGDGFVRTIDVLVADVQSGSFKVDPEELRAIVGQLDDLYSQMSAADTHTRSQIPQGMPANVNSINVEADITWNTLATGAKERGAPSLDKNMQDLRNVVGWLYGSLSSALSAYVGADSQSAAAMNKAASRSFDTGGSTAGTGAGSAPAGTHM